MHAAVQHFKYFSAPQHEFFVKRKKYFMLGYLAETYVPGAGARTG
jgi:hypothetical protein